MYRKENIALLISLLNLKNRFNRKTQPIKKYIETHSFHRNTMDALEEQQKKVVVKYKPTYRLEPLEERKYVEIYFSFQLSFLFYLLFVLEPTSKKNTHTNLVFVSLLQLYLSIHFFVFDLYILMLFSIYCLYCLDFRRRQPEKYVKMY